MRTIIAGSRNFNNYNLMNETIKNVPWIVTKVISGTAKGADRLGERWAIERNIPVERFYADWAKFGKSAGPIRNAQMASIAEALIAFPSKESCGTRSMIEIAKRCGLLIKIVEEDE